LNVFAQLTFDPTSNDSFIVSLLYFQPDKQGELQEATQPASQTSSLPSSTATKETSTTSNHLKDLVTPELVEADTTSTPGVFNLYFYNNLIF
jgi:hypothetical protein